MSSSSPATSPRAASTASPTTPSGNGSAPMSASASETRPPSNLPPVTAPVVVVMAAGQGTRMRSKTPKVLHELCGRPMVEWPIAAAREAGAAKVVVVDGPQKPLEDRLPEGVEDAVQ